MPAAGNYCPQREQSCDNFSQSKPACPCFCLYWQLLKVVFIRFFFFHWHLHLYSLQDETVKREKSLQRIFKKSLLFVMNSLILQSFKKQCCNIRNYMIVVCSGLCCSAASAESLVVAHKGWESPKSLPGKIRASSFNPTEK